METLGTIAAVAGVLALAGIIAAALLGDDPDAGRRRKIDAQAERRRAAAHRRDAARKEANR